MTQITRHPVATGLAKALVDSHATEQPLKFYAGWFCPWIWYGNQYNQPLLKHINTFTTTSLPLEKKKTTNIKKKPLSPLSVQRTWMTLEEKKIPYQYIEINPYDKSPALLALNPKGLVPTIGAPLANNQGTIPLYESNIINEYLEEAYPDHKPQLLPTDPIERARARIWIDFVGSRITPNYRKIQYATSAEESVAARAGF
ncbi:hypothetical protein ACJ72_06351 [Emergomyces africanus]|uniref:GST N-terminal domain-containing protein n=1 Tax=Emergomyces africanus TaxID=1955775 RepID=A0A1B7NRR6_9EURO|nr:hypothetical protein ACJ72_06351 [Emergomyces africanus]